MLFPLRLYFPSFDVTGAGEGAGAGGAGAGAGGGAGVASPPAGGSGDGAAPKGTDAVIAASRARLAEGKPLIETPAEKKVPDAAAAAAAQGAGDGAAGTDEAGKGEGDGAAEGADGAAGAGEEGGESSELDFVLEGMEDRGEEPLVLEAPDKATLERLNRLRNDASEGVRLKATRAEVEQRHQELTEVEDMLMVDPAGFVLDKMPEAHRLDIAKQMLFQPEIFKALKDTIAEAMDDPNALKLIQAQLRGDRLELKEKLKTSLTERRSMEESGRKIVAELHRLIPETITGSKRQMLLRDAIGDIKETAERLGKKTLDPKDVLLIVADRFREHGIDLRAIGGKEAPRGSTQSPAPKPPAKANGGAKTGQQFREESERRRAAAAAAPAGAGAPGAGAGPNLPDLGEQDGKRTDRVIKALRLKGIRAGMGQS